MTSCSLSLYISLLLSIVCSYLDDMLLWYVGQDLVQEIRLLNLKR